MLSDVGSKSGKNPQATTHTCLTHPTTTTVSFTPFPSYHPATRPFNITTESRPSFFEDDSDSEEDVLSDAGRTEESDYIPYISLIIQHEQIICHSDLSAYTPGPRLLLLPLDPTLLRGPQ